MNANPFAVPCRHRISPPGFRSLVTIASVLAAPAALAGVITVGNHTLLPGTPNQTFTIPVSGTDAIGGENFFAQIGDGGAFNGGSDTRPVFQNVDILTNTIWAGNNTGATGDPKGTPAGSNAGHPLIWADGTTAKTGTVTDNGTFATVTIDTTGVSSGTFPLILTGVANTQGEFDTALVGPTGATVPMTINNGLITIAPAPEPTGLAALALGGLALLGRRRRAR